MEPESNPLQLFLDSLKAMAHLPDETLVLPSHGRPFRGAPVRLRQLREHHEERLNELMVCCRQQAISAYEALPTLFKRALDVHQTTFAMGEAIAHLHWLWRSGRADRLLGDDGVYRFRATQS
jgi:glyoxylase-like metal-dependent hydrolase (beta-lactamase superfamily II)